MTDTLTLHVADGIATVRLDRPAAGNAIDEAMAADLLAVATRLTGDPAVRAVLLCGSGPMFCAGGDIDVFAATADVPSLLRSMLDDFHSAIERLVALDAPIVVAVHGAAAGGGLALVCAADVVVASADAVFAAGYGALGLSADGGSTWHLPRLVGMRRAQELFLLHRRLTAAEAQEWGIVTRVVPDLQVDAEAAAIAAQLAAGPTRAFGAVRRLLRRSPSDLRDQMAAEQDEIVTVAATSDAAEGITAFAARRRPKFTGS